MSGDDFVILPNGKKIFLKDIYGSVSENKISPKSRMFSLFMAFNKDFQNDLSPDEVKSVFDSLKNYAAQDGNNELSTAELMGFVKEHLNDDYEAQMITAKEVMKCLEIIQKESEKSLDGKKTAHIENTTAKLFPELEFLDLGLDNNIDMSKLSFEEMKKHFPQDKYSIEEKTWTEYINFDETGHIVSRSIEEFPGSQPRERTAKYIINNETGKVVISFKDNDFNNNGYNIDINDEKTGRAINICSFGNNVSISTPTVNWDDATDIHISDGNVDYARNGKEQYNFHNGILDSKFTDSYTILYENGIEVSKKKHKEQAIIQNNEIHTEQIRENEYVNPNQLAELLVSGDFQEFGKLINASINSNEIGTVMDDYYALTGRELIDDIKNSDMPKEDKNRILNKMCEPFVDSKFYDANKKIENSRIDNKYYTSSDEYDINYNGPIINVHNKTTGKTTRINLKTLLKDMSFRKDKYLEKSLQTIQSYPGEVLENIGIEIEDIFTLTRQESKDSFHGKGGMAGGYYGNKIKIPTLHRLKGGVLVHEMAHGIDNAANIYEMFSSNSNFKKVYDECIKCYTESGHRRFDDYHPMRSMPILPINNGTNYATYNENEAFAICMQILMGYEDSHTKFVRKVMPELIDAAKELYLEIRNKPQEERREI